MTPRALLLALACFVPACASKSNPPPAEQPGGTVCTMDAKLCPDGTSVGRTGPNCEFAPCPGTPSETTEQPPAAPDPAAEAATPTPP